MLDSLYVTVSLADTLLLVFVTIFQIALFPGLLLGTEATMEMPTGAEFPFSRFPLVIYFVAFCNEK